MERHAAPAWQSWGVISVCRLQEGVTAAQRELPSQLEQALSAFSIGKKGLKGLPAGSSASPGQTGELKGQKASLAKRGTRPSKPTSTVSPGHCHLASTDGLFCAPEGPLWSTAPSQLVPYGDHFGVNAILSS